MKKTNRSALIAMISLIFLIILSISTASAAISTTNTVSKVTTAGVDITDSLSIQNTGATPINITFFDKTLTKGSDSLEININNIQNIAAGSTITAPFSIDVASSQATGNYTGTLILNDGSGNTSIDYSIQVLAEANFESNVNSISIEANYGHNQSKSFKLSNLDSSTIEDLEISYDSSEFKDNDGDEIILFFSDDQFDLSGDKTINLIAQVPLEMDQGSYSGKIKISNSETSLDIPINITLESIIQILNVEVKSYDVDDEVYPGEDIQVQVEIKNNYDEDDDNNINIDLNDVVITVKIMDGSKILDDDDNEDLEEDGDKFRLRSGDKSTQTITLTMPGDDLRDGDVYDIRVEVVGENDDKSSQEFFSKDISESIKVVKYGHKLLLRDVQFGPTTLSCSRSSSLSFSVENVGSSIEDDVKVTVFSPELGVNFARTFDLDDDLGSSKSKESIAIPIDATGVSPGKYTIKLKIKYDNYDETLEESYILYVEACDKDNPITDDSSQDNTNNQDDNTATTDDENSQPEDNTNLITDNTDNTDNATNSTTDQTVDEKKKFADSPWFIVSIVIGAIVIVAIIVLAVLISRMD